MSKIRGAEGGVCPQEPVPVQAPPAADDAAAGDGEAGAEAAVGREGRPAAPGRHQQAHEEAAHQTLYDGWVAIYVVWNLIFH